MQRNGQGHRITVALYARVSTSEQSVESQLLALRDFAVKRGFTVAGEYSDVVTGSEKRRASAAAQFQRLMKDVTRGALTLCLFGSWTGSPGRYGCWLKPWASSRRLESTS